MKQKKRKADSGYTAMIERICGVLDRCAGVRVCECGKELPMDVAQVEAKVLSEAMRGLK
jgi:hypothetical protein